MMARNCLPPSRPRSSRTSLMLSNAQNALPRPSSRSSVLTTWTHHHPSRAGIHSNTHRPWIYLYTAIHFIDLCTIDQ